MEIILLILADVALGGIAWRLGKKNEEANKNMGLAIKQMGEAVIEMRRMNDSLMVRVERVEDRVKVLESAA